VVVGNGYLDLLGIHGWWFTVSPELGGLRKSTLFLQLWIENQLIILRPN
jgi:hypothetical protein